jgi:hypothetical protein
MPEANRRQIKIIIMKNLKELWSAVLEGQEEQKNNYYATLVQIGVHGRSKFYVSEDDIENQFGENLRELFMPKDCNNRVRSIVVIERLSNENEEQKYTIFILEHSQDQENNEFIARLKNYKGEIVGTKLTMDEYREEFTKSFDITTIKCWKDILDLFEI